MLSLCMGREGDDTSPAVGVETTALDALKSWLVVPLTAGWPDEIDAVLAASAVVT